MEENKLNYNPLYLQVKDVLMRRIVEGKHKPGELLPSESRLAADFGTSISTIRQALSLLVADGVLSKKQGKGTSVAEKKVVLSFLSWIGETPRGHAILQDLVERFEKKNPTIVINIVPTTFTDTKKDLLRLSTNGTAPDVAQIVSPWTMYFAAMGALAPLEEYVSAENLASRFPDKDLLGGTYNGKVFSVAWGLCPLSLIANKNVLREAGICIDHLPLSLEEFAEICENISRCSTDTRRYAYALNVRHDETDFLRIYTFLQAFGGEFVDDAGQVVFNSRENKEGFTWVRKLMETSRIYTGDIYSIRERFARNEIAFMTDGPWIKYILEELTGQDFDRNFRVILNPARRDHPSITWNYNHALAICSQSRNKYHAGLFIDQVTNDPDLSDYYFSATGHLPSNRCRLDSMLLRGEFFQAFHAQLAHAKCINAGNSMFEKAMVLAMDAVKKILFEGVDIETELNEKEYYLNMLYYG